MCRLLRCGTGRICAARLIAAETFTGKVVAITDGDTLTVVVDRQQVKVRLEGIDTPEKGQPFGTKAKEALGKLVFGKDVAVRSTGTDR